MSVSTDGTKSYIVAYGGNVGVWNTTGTEFGARAVVVVNKED